jgi:hypothetical protein
LGFVVGQTLLVLAFILGGTLGLELGVGVLTMNQLVVLSLAEEGSVSPSRDLLAPANPGVEPHTGEEREQGQGPHAEGD